jgi:cell division protein FtsB
MFESKNIFEDDYPDEYSYESDGEYYELTEADQILREYKNKMANVLLSEVKAEIEHLRNENKSLKENNVDLRSQISKIDSVKAEFERSKEKYKREVIKEYQKEYFGGIVPNDYIWTIHSDVVQDICPKCGGKHKIVITILDDTKTVDCPFCSYGGKVIVDKTFKPIKRKVSETDLKIWADGRAFERKFWLEEIKGEPNEVSDSQYNRERDLARCFYITEEDCQIACDKLRQSWINKTNE